MGDTPLSIHVKSLVRKFSSDSDASPDSKGPATKKLNMASCTDIKEIKDQLTKILEEQTSLRQSLETRIQNLQKILNDKIEKECKKLNDDFQIEITRLGDELKLVKDSVSALDTKITNEVEAIKTRVTTLETGAGIRREPFDPEVTIIVTGLKYDDNEIVKSKAEALIHEGIGDNTVEVVDAIRTPFRNNRPGIVKIELSDKDTKIRVLRNKTKLAADNRYARVFIRSSQSHTERLLHLNTMTMLREIGQEGKYRVTGSGRVVLKSPEDAYQATQGRGPAHQWATGPPHQGQHPPFGGPQLFHPNGPPNGPPPPGHHLPYHGQHPPHYAHNQQANPPPQHGPHSQGTS